VTFLAGMMDEKTRFARNDFRSTVSRFAPEVLPANIAIVNLIRSWAQRKEATSAQIALAWLQAQRPWIVPIPSTTQAPHLSENIGADEVRFTVDELAQLNSDVAGITIQGARLTEAALANTGVEAPLKR
jgi:aryl-alcohol dehydrogenase-like predicted oxidoreductase